MKAVREGSVFFFILFPPSIPRSLYVGFPSLLSTPPPFPSPWAWERSPFLQVEYLVFFPLLYLLLLLLLLVLSRPLLFVLKARNSWVIQSCYIQAWGRLESLSTRDGRIPPDSRLPNSLPLVCVLPLLPPPPPSPPSLLLFCLVLALICFLKLLAYLLVRWPSGPRIITNNTGVPMI